MDADTDTQTVRESKEKPYKAKLYFMNHPRYALIPGSRAETRLKGTDESVLGGGSVA